MTDGNPESTEVTLARMEERQKSMADRVEEMFDHVKEMDKKLTSSCVEIGKMQAQIKWLWMIIFLLVSSLAGMAFTVMREVS